MSLIVWSSRHAEGQDRRIGDRQFCSCPSSRPFQPMSSDRAFAMRAIGPLQSTPLTDSRPSTNLFPLLMYPHFSFVSTFNNLSQYIHLRNQMLASGRKASFTRARFWRTGCCEVFRLIRRAPPRFIASSCQPAGVSIELFLSGARVSLRSLPPEAKASPSQQ